MAADRRSGLLSRAIELSGTVRVRTTAAAVLVVGAALLISAAAMVVLLRRSLTSDVRASAVLRAESVVAELASGHLRQPIPMGDEEEEFVQVLDTEGRVVAASANLAGRPSVVRLAPGETQPVDGLPFEDDPFLAVAVSAPAPPRPLTVIVGRTLETVTESTREVTALLATGVPLLVLVVTFASWWGIGRALAPVEAMRAEVDAVSSNELHRRLSDPPGRDEIARLGATMNRMLARLEEGQERQRRFISDASHELRSPVTSIRQHAEVALSHPDATSTEELAEVVLEEDLRLQHLVEDLLLLTKIDEGTFRLRTEAVDLDDVVLEEAKRLRATTDLRIDTGGVSAGRVAGDGGQLKRLVRNLTDNARRHSHGAVALWLGEREGGVVLGVEDDGDGIPASERDRIFQRFVRLDDARDRDSGGVGLGLAIVAEIAAAHEATVSVFRSRLGGARFEVRFRSQAG